MKSSLMVLGGVIVAMAGALLLNGYIGWLLAPSQFVAEGFTGSVGHLVAGLLPYFLGLALFGAGLQRLDSGTAYGSFVAIWVVISLYCVVAEGLVVAGNSGGMPLVGIFALLSAGLVLALAIVKVIDRLRMSRGMSVERSAVSK
jgi:hypothetical protein